MICRLLTADPTRRKFWRFVNHMVENTVKITAVSNKAGQMVFDLNEIEQVVTDHFATIFAGQRVPPSGEDRETLDQHTIARAEMEQVVKNCSKVYTNNCFEDYVCESYTYQELNDELQHLPNQKSAGIDGIPNELLKNSGPKFRQYLIEFLNKILRNGQVPEALNVGKCILIYKVYSFI